MRDSFRLKALFQESPDRDGSKQMHSSYSDLHKQQIQAQSQTTELIRTRFRLIVKYSYPYKEFVAVERRQGSHVTAPYVNLDTTRSISEPGSYFSVKIVTFFNVMIRYRFKPFRTTWQHGGKTTQDFFHSGLNINNREVSQREKDCCSTIFAKYITKNPYVSLVDCNM